MFWYWLQHQHAGGRQYFGEISNRRYAGCCCETVHRDIETVLASPFLARRAKEFSGKHETEKEWTTSFKGDRTFSKGSVLYISNYDDC